MIVARDEEGAGWFVTRIRGCRFLVVDPVRGLVRMAYALLPTTPSRSSPARKPRSRST